MSQGLSPAAVPPDLGIAFTQSRDVCECRRHTRQQHRHRWPRWFLAKSFTKNMISRPKAAQNKIIHGGATVLTLFPVQQRLASFPFVCSRSPCGNSLPQAWETASRDFEQELPTNLLIITQRFHVVVLISRCSLSKRPTLLCTLSPKSCNLNDATNSSSSDSPSTSARCCLSTSTLLQSGAAVKQHRPHRGPCVRGCRSLLSKLFSRRAECQEEDLVGKHDVLLWFPV